MKNSENQKIEISRFTEFFVRKNNLVDRGFKEWFFSPGMEFNSLDKWWGDFKKRPRHHEGLDLCLYRDRNNKIKQVGEKSQIPAMYTGKVVGFIKDFLGESVILEHDWSQRFCTIYAHTIPRRGLSVGDRVNSGDVIAFVASKGGLKSGISPHLHITMGWVIGEMSYESLKWSILGNDPSLKLVDPLKCINSKWVLT